MINNYIKNFSQRYRALKTVQLLMSALILVLVLSAVTELLKPLPLQNANQLNPPRPDSYIAEPNFFSSSNNLILDDFNFRTGFFKSDSKISDRPIADKTIERIKNQLKLKCVMELNSAPTAYINIEGMGLKKCQIGDSISDLFTVLDIDKKNKTVEISIIDHKVTLHL